AAAPRGGARGAPPSRGPRAGGARARAPPRTAPDRRLRSPSGGPQLPEVRPSPAPRAPAPVQLGRAARPAEPPPGYGGQMYPAPLGFGKHPTEGGVMSRGSQSTTFGEKMMTLMTQKETQ